MRWLGAITLFGLALRVWAIGAKGLWLDEAFSIWMSRHALTELFDWLVRIDQHPPLYYLLLHGWLTFGDQEGWVRTLSALFSTATIPLFYLFVRSLLDVKTGLVAALILALAPFHVRFAQETRMYALLACMAAAAMLCLALILTTPGRASEPYGRRWTRRLAWIGYVLCTTATLLTHNTAIFFPLAVNLFVLGWIAWRRWRPAAPTAVDASRKRAPGQPPLRPLEPPALASWLYAQAAIVALWLPWSAAFVRQSLGVDAQFWIPAPTLQTILDTLGVFMTGAFADGWFWPGWVWLFFGLFFAMGAYALRVRPPVLALLLLLWLTPFAGEWLVSLRRPIFYDRTLIWASLPFYAVVAVGIASLHSRAVIAAALVALAALQLFSLNSYYRDFRKEEWREAAAYVVQQVRPGDLLLFNATWVQIPFDYYFDRYELAVPQHGAPADLFDAGVLEPVMTPADAPRLHALLQKYARVWLIYSHNWYTDPQGLVPDTLEQKLDLRSRQPFYGLELRLYAAKESSLTAAPDDWIRSFCVLKGN